MMSAHFETSAQNPTSCLRVFSLAIALAYWIVRRFILTYNDGRVSLGNPKLNEPAPPNDFSLFGFAERGSSLVFDPHRFDVQEFAYAVSVKLAPVARMFDAPERQAWVARHHAVDKD